MDSENIKNGRTSQHKQAARTSTECIHKVHSTETALLKVQSDIMLALDLKKICVLVLLDLSATFDTIDHQALLQRLKALYGINGMALKWLSLYVSNRQQSVAIEGYMSEPAAVEFGVPQGSALGPKLYTMYTKPLGSLITDHGLDYHMYADKTQEYVSFDIKQADQQSDAIQKLKCYLNDA